MCVHGSLPLRKSKREQMRKQLTAAKGDGDFTKWIVRVLTISVIIIGSLLGSATLIGLVTVVLGFDDPANILIGYGFLCRYRHVSREEV